MKRALSIVSKRRAIAWGVQVQHFAIASEGQLSRAVTISQISDGTFAGVAVQYARDSASLADVFASHSHKDLGVHSTLSKAKRAATVHLREPFAPEQACECEVTAPARKPRARKKAARA